MNDCIKIMTIIATATTAASAATLYKADLQFSGGPVAAGWQGPTNSVGFNSLAMPSYTFGDGVTLNFTTQVNNYSLGNTANPVITDGIFVNSGTGSGQFTLSGLGAGDKVTLYAMHAWDGNGRGALVSFGGSPLVDSTTTPDVTSATPPVWALDPQPENFVLVATDVIADSFGTVSGYVSHTDGVINRPEGQLGGLIFSVTPVPEPVAAAVAAPVIFMLLRRRTAR